MVTMRCFKCTAYNGQICLQEPDKMCPELLTGEKRERRQQLFRKACTLKEERSIDCKDCPQIEICKAENNWSGDHCKTQLEKENEDNAKIETDFIRDGQVDVEYMGSGMYKVKIWDYNGKSFYFTTRGTFTNSRNEQNDKNE